MGRANHFRQRESLFVQPSEQVFEVHYAGDRVEIPVGHRIGVEQVVFDDLFDLVVRGVDVQPHQFAAVRHDRPYVAVAEVEYAFHDVLFDFLDLAADGSFLDDRFDLVFGDFAFSQRIDSEQAQHAGSAL